MLKGSIYDIKTYPTLVTNNSITIELPKKGLQMQLISADGRQLFYKDFRNSEGVVVCQLPHVPQGIYMLRFWGNNSNEYRKIRIQ